jgi:hypothetical protein
MGRYSSTSSYDHRITDTRDGFYRLSWCVDYYSSGSRLRFPRGFRRDTDIDGAKRFAKKWSVPLPSTPSKG